MEKINHNGVDGYFLSEKEYTSLCESQKEIFRTISEIRGGLSE